MFIYHFYTAKLVFLAMSTHTRNFDALFRALKCCLTENKGIRVAAQEYGVQKSTLQRHVQHMQVACSSELR